MNNFSTILHRFYTSGVKFCIKRWKTGVKFYTAGVKSVEYCLFNNSSEKNQAVFIRKPCDYSKMFSNHFPRTILSQIPLGNIMLMADTRNRNLRKFTRSHNLNLLFFQNECQAQKYYFLLLQKSSLKNSIKLMRNENRQCLYIPTSSLILFPSFPSTYLFALFLFFFLSNTQKNCRG